MTRKALDLVSGARALEIEAALPKQGGNGAEALSIGDFKRARQRSLAEAEEPSEPVVGADRAGHDQASPALGIP
ncbi:MAG TPA: hypothetical protein VK509_23070, partial [Polyangiales bacterium]|nr:hypothetical protein [Polyangiales bacterium]